MAVEKDYEFFPRQKLSTDFFGALSPAAEKKTGSDVRSEPRPEQVFSAFAGKTTFRHRASIVYLSVQDRR